MIVSRPANVELPVGEVLVHATFTPTGRFAGDLELWHGDGVVVDDIETLSFCVRAVRGGM